MTYPDPYRPQQQWPSGPYPPVPPGYAYPPGGGYPPSPSQQYRQSSGPHHGSPAARQNDGNGWGWCALDSVLFCFGIWTTGFGKNVRDRVKVTLLLLTGTVVVIAVLVLISVLLSH
jgi:hypothetical protein